MNQFTKKIVVFGLMASAAIASAQVNSGSDGSDGPFNVNADTTVDLALAPTRSDLSSPSGGNGVYLAPKWAVVFRYSSVNIAAGKTVRFTNHPKNPPVVWLVQGDVTINGTVVLDAKDPTGDGLLSVPGPGGFRGASNDSLSLSRGAGLGPGGSSSTTGYADETGASYGTAPTAGNVGAKGPIYGNEQILPLVGGSGSKSRGYTGDGAYGGGAGGGAILIVATGTITVSGTIQANGTNRGSASGSGGAIRLVANQIVGSGFLKAIPNGNSAYGGYGRIRLERLNAASSFGGTPSPNASTAVLAGPDPTIWPSSTQPSLKVLSVDGVPVPDDPASNFVTPDLQVGPAPSSIIRLEAKNIPTDGTWRVQVRIVPRSGPDQFATATLITPGTTSIWEASVVLPPGGSAVIARAYKL